MSGILVPIAFFAMIAAIFIVPRYFKSREREELQQTVRAAIERGQPLPQEIIEAMTSNVAVRLRPSPVTDMRKAVVWIAVSLGFVILAYTVGWNDEGDAFYPLLAVASIPGLVGLSYLAMAAINSGAGKRKLTS